MPGFLIALANLLVYKLPKNEELGFELLEENDEENKVKDTNENKNTVQPSENSNLQTKDEQKKLKRQIKEPLKVYKWNETRKEENPCKPKEDSETLTKELCITLETVKKKFGLPKNKDVIIREFKIGRKIKAFMAYIDGMMDKQMLNLAIYPQLMSKELSEEIGEEYPVDYLIDNVLSIHSVTRETRYSKIIELVLNGFSALFIEDCNECILIETKGYEKRNVETTKTETVVKGPQEGFNENLRTNLTLIRRIIRNEKLITETLQVGKTNKLSCAIVYLDDVANPRVINEVKKRILRIDTDFVLGNGIVEQFIEDNPFMLFPQVITTERPDRTASFIMEGQVVIITEGAPFSMAVPVTFFRLLHTSEDSFTRWPFGTFLRMIRIFGLFCATLLPGLYISIVMFHPEMIPTELLSSISKAKELVPFPTVVEVIIMEFSFELIREGGIRVPSVIGQTLGIVGALILGQAAVAAGLVSPILVIIVSVTALGSFAIPNYSLSLAIRIERFFFIAAGALLGFLGIAVLIFILACLACSMKSFGVPFFSPVAPRTKYNLDVAIKGPVWMQKKFPDEFQTLRKKRQGSNVKVWMDETGQEEKEEKEEKEEEKEEKEGEDNQ